MTAKNDEIIDLLSNYNQNQLFYRKNNRKNIKIFDNYQ